MHNNCFVKATLLFCIGLIGCTALTAEEIPWPLAQDYSRDPRPINKYIESLGTITNSKVVGTFRKQLRDRVAADKKIVASGEQNPQYERAKEELVRYDVFLGRLGQRLYFVFNGEVDLAKNKVTFNYASLRTRNSNVQVAAHKDDSKCYFFQNATGCIWKRKIWWRSKSSSVSCTTLSFSFKDWMIRNTKSIALWPINV